MGQSVSRRVITATVVAGTLDILSAVVYTLMAGGTAAGMLRSVAGAIWPAAKQAGLAGSAIGLVLHFAIMAVMAAVFVIAADRMPVLKARWVAAGIAYGIALWAVMNLIVLPARYGFHPFTTKSLVQQFFSHVALVGLPIAWFARK